jgi:hypothetical protein
VKPRRRSRSLYVLAACLAASAVLHLWALAQAQEASRRALVLPRRPVVLTGTVRAPVPGSGGVAPARKWLTASSTPAVLRDEIEPPPVLGGTTISSLSPLPALAPLTLTNAGAPADDWETYVPRPLLSLPPSPQEPVMLVWPEFQAQAAHYEAVLALYIDETGRVQAARVQGQDLPAPLVEAARLAFEGRRFSPGELQGQAVRSRIFVEISFDQEPPAAGGNVHSPRNLSR